MAAGQIGEKIEAAQTNLASFPATTTWGDLGNVVLTPGTWQLTAMLTHTLNGATQTTFSVGICTNSGNSIVGAVYGQSVTDGLPGTSAYYPTISVPNFIVNVSSNTTYYCKVYATYSAGTPQYRGRLTAIRIG